MMKIIVSNHSVGFQWFLEGNWLEFKIIIIPEYTNKKIRI